ncbi:hypothetical protein VLK31_19275 [Variovorax sp. H27-G14]|uniref:hypothetical protein n=1 Tax=Variovorax sp. H27-G14 TaxID=3111914 RepID=UPI0038FC5C4A
MSTLSDPTPAHNTAHLLRASTLAPPAAVAKPGSRFIEHAMKALLRIFARGATDGGRHRTVQTLTSAN